MIVGFEVAQIEGCSIYPEGGTHIMVRRCIVTLASLGVAVLVTTPVLSCTTVCVLEKDKTVVAYNYDFYPSEGLVLVNKRGMRKVSFIRAQGAT